MKRLGLTGSIGMGKSTISAMFRDRGIAVYDADAAIHDLYKAGGAGVEPLANRFGTNIIVKGAIDRGRLRSVIIKDTQALSDLEAIIHPLLAQSRKVFEKKAHDSGAKLAVFDIPLLFETGGDKDCDLVVIVTAPQDIQRARVLARPGMNGQILKTILARQMPDHEKRARADFIINTAFGFDFARAHVDAIIALFTCKDRK